MSMIEVTNLKPRNEFSILGSQSVMKPTHQKEKKSFVTALVLTSLIDCFVILVSYLLMAASIGLETLDMPKDMQLPLATKSDVLEKATVILIHDDQYFIDNTPIAMDQLGPKLAEIKKTAKPDAAVIIQADRRTSFLKLNPAVLAGIQAGFAQVRFAVKQGDGN